MSIEHLVTMANQIGDFFRFEPDKAQAKADIAGHLKHTWEPRMRKQIVEHVQAGGAGLEPEVIDAIREHQSALI